MCTTTTSTITHTTPGGGQKLAPMQDPTPPIPDPLAKHPHLFLVSIKTVLYLRVPCKYETHLCVAAEDWVRFCLARVLHMGLGGEGEKA
jgi:hypothetical protein